MRYFWFELRLPDGRRDRVEVEAEHWTEAFSHACQVAEARHGLGTYDGIVCVDYDAAFLPAA